MLLRCKMCGGGLKNLDNLTVCECEFCGSKQTLPKTKDDVIENLFNRANNLRLKCEFDKAISIYEKIIEKDDSEAEAHWGTVLCRYGIEYVEDPRVYKTKVGHCPFSPNAVRYAQTFRGYRAGFARCENVWKDFAYLL